MKNLNKSSWYNKYRAIRAGKRPYLVVQEGFVRRLWYSAPETVSKYYIGWSCIPTGGISYLVIRRPKWRIVLSSSNEQCQKKFKGWKTFKLMP